MLILYFMFYGRLLQTETQCFALATSNTLVFSQVEVYRNKLWSQILLITEYMLYGGMNGWQWQGYTLTEKQ